MTWPLSLNNFTLNLIFFLTGIDMLLKQLRIQKGLSQEALAEKSNISVRTLQRIENGKNANMTTLTTLAGVLEVDVETLTCTNSPIQSWSDPQKSFISHCISFVVVMLSLTVISITSEHSQNWVWWVFLGWSIYLFYEGLDVFGILHSIDE